MEKTVGKPRIKSSLVYCLLITIYAALMYIADAWQGIRIFAVALIIVVYTIVLPSMSYSLVMWKVNDKSLMYTYHHTIIDKIISFYKHIFKTKKLEYQMNVYLNQIDYIEVDFVKVLRGPYAQYGYDIIFCVYTNDGSEFRFNVLDASKRREFNAAVDFLKDKNIEFVDQYNILEQLKNNPNPISYYLKDIKKEEKL